MKSYSVEMLPIKPLLLLLLLCRLIKTMVIPGLIRKEKKVLNARVERILGLFFFSSYKRTSKLKVLTTLWEHNS